MTDFRVARTGETEAQFLEFLASLYTQTSAGSMMAATGVVAGEGLVVSQTSPASSVVVSAGVGVAQSSVTAGALPAVNDSAKTLDVLLANPAASTPRNDIVVLDCSLSTGNVRVITGTPNATPTDPTVPATCVKLARLRIAANATTITSGQIDDLRTATYLRGVRPAPTIASRTTNYTLSGGTLSPALLTCPMPAVNTSTRCRVVAYVPGFSSTVPDDRVLIRLHDGAGTLVGGGYVSVSAGTAGATTFVGQIDAPAPSGSVTMTAQRVAGTGNVTLRGSEGWTLEVIPV